MVTSINTIEFNLIQSIDIFIRSFSLLCSITNEWRNCLQQVTRILSLELLCMYFVKTICSDCCEAVEMKTCWCFSTIREIVESMTFLGIPLFFTFTYSIQFALPYSFYFNESLSEYALPIRFRVVYDEVRSFSPKLLGIGCDGTT